MKNREKEGWGYHYSANVLAAAKLYLFYHYIDKQRSTITKTIRSRPILLEYMRAKRQTGGHILLPLLVEADLEL